MIQALGTGKPVEIRAKTPSGPKITKEDVDRWNSAADVTEKQEMKLQKIIQEMEEFERMKDTLQFLN